MSKAAIFTGFDQIEVLPAANERNDIENGRDGDLGTKTYVTTGGTEGTATVYFGFSSPKAIRGFRWLKATQNIDGTGGPNDPMNLVFKTTSDSIGTALTSRSFANVTNLTNGVDGTELLQFASGGGINVGTATAVRENGLGVDDGNPMASSYYSVTFDPIMGATGIAMQFSPGEVNIFTHYNAYEFFAIEVPEPSMGLTVMGLTVVIAGFVRRRQHGWS
jgi:hypothetical protein